MLRFKKALALLLALATATFALCGGLATSANTADKTLFCGDADRDGTRGTSDVRQVLFFVIGQEDPDDEQYALGDYDDSGTLTSSDARLILSAILNQEPLRPFVLLRAAGYTGDAYVTLNDNQPRFSDAQKAATTVFETYSPLDGLGRCGEAFANLCQELMPTEDRGSLSSVTPTGWHNKQYDIVPGGWVYNRCHIIGFQLAGEQANPLNLITGTRYMNTAGMLPFENQIAAYIEETDNHVLYRATPLFVKDNLLAEGVRLEAWSVEDGGEGISLHVFCYNVQDGIVFDYATGENRAADDLPDDGVTVIFLYILNTKSKKFHYPDCGSAASISEQYREEYEGTRDDLILQGYVPCGNCDP